MLKFVFLLTVWGEGGVEIHAMDTRLSGEDCIARIEWAFEHDPQFENGIPSCEVDLAGWYTPEGWGPYPPSLEDKLDAAGDAAIEHGIAVPAVPLTAPEHVISDGFSYGIGETITATPRPEARP